MMYHVAAVLSLAAIASAQQLTWMCRPYAFMKVMESCVGKDVVYKHKMKMMTTVKDTCLSRPTTWEDMMDEEPMHGEEMMDDHHMEDKKPGMGDMEPGKGGMMGDMMGDMMDNMMAGMMDKMEGMKSSMMMGPDMFPVLSNITCIMQEMHWMDEHHMPNPMAMKKLIKSLNLNPFMTKMMKKDIDHCAEQSMCSIDDEESPFGPRISKMMHYLKCVGYKMFGCCAMNEMMMKLPMGPMGPPDMTALEKMTIMSQAMEKNAQQDPIEMMNDATFMMIVQTMFGPMSPFMQ